MEFIGNISKMRVEQADPIKYFLTLGEKEIFMNQYIGQEIEIEYQDQINCIHCSTKTNKSYNQGYCYNCFSTLPECDAGVLFPEKDMAHIGISRDMDWARNNSLVDHYVYLAITGNIKVGVTRSTNLPTTYQSTLSFILNPPCFRIFTTSPDSNIKY